MTDKKTEPAQKLSKLEEANAQGFIGERVDPTPDAAYTLAGVTAGKPTPETDDKAAKKADDAAGV